MPSMNMGITIITIITMGMTMTIRTTTITTPIPTQNTRWGLKASANT
jgi:hypothetical protein